MRRRHQTRGYVLMVTLILVALAGLALVGASRAALRQAAGAIEAERELQERWGILSCRRVLLPRAEAVLRSEEKLRREPVVAVRRSIVLGELRLDLILSDEQAKASVNTLLRLGDKADAETRLRKLLSGSGLTTHVRLRPTVGVGDGTNAVPIVGSLGQVFDLTPATGRLADGPEPVVDRVTCWGDGRLNLRRTDERTLREVCVPALDLAQLGRLVELREIEPELSLSQVLDRLQLTADRRIAAQSLLTEKSACHSLWVLAHHGGRMGYHLYVGGANVADGNGVERFEF